MTSDCMIRRLPHFVKPDEDRTAQLRDLEEYIEDDRDKSGLSRGRATSSGTGRGGHRALDVAASGRSTMGVDLSEIPAYPRRRGPRSDRPRRIEISDPRTLRADARSRSRR